MILHIAKVGALFVAAGVGHYIGDLLGSGPLDALPYEYWGSTRYEHYYRGVFVGAFTTSFVYLASKFLKTPELASLLVAFAYSIYLPVKQMSIIGEALFSVPGLYTIGGYQAPYFLGLLVALGLVHVARLSLQAFRPNSNY
jgi:hypothetical protein